MAIDVFYFAWLRERIGHPRERIETDAAPCASWSPSLPPWTNGTRRPVGPVGGAGRWIRN